MCLLSPVAPWADVCSIGSSLSGAIVEAYVSALVWCPGSRRLFNWFFSLWRHVEAYVSALVCCPGSRRLFNWFSLSLAPLSRHMCLLSFAAPWTDVCSIGLNGSIGSSLLSLAPLSIADSHCLNLGIFHWPVSTSTCWIFSHAGSLVLTNGD